MMSGGEEIRLSDMASSDYQVSVSHGIPEGTEQKLKNDQLGKLEAEQVQVERVGKIWTMLVAFQRSDTLSSVRLDCGSSFLRVF